MAAAVDLGYLSSYLSLPLDTLATVASAPTPDLVTAILDAVAVKAREFDSLFSEKLQVDIELENAVRSSESRCESFKATANNALKDVEDLRRKLQEEETSRQAAENQLQSLKAESTTSLAEVETLRARIASLETSKRDTLAILDTKNAANAELSDELQRQHQKNLDLSQELAGLQQEVQTAKAAVNSAKFREQALRQELEFAQRSNEWLENELKTKSADALKVRKEKGERIAELQRLNEEATSNVEALTRSEQQLRSRLDVAQKKTEEGLAKIQQIQEAAARSDAGYRQEVEAAKRLAEVSRDYAEQYKNEIKQLKMNLEQVKDSNSDELRRVLQNLEQAREECTQLEQQNQELLAELDQARALASTQAQVVPGSAPQTPRQNGGLLRAGSPFGTPAAIRKSAITATQAMEELYKVKAELTGEKRRTRDLTEQLDEMMNVLEAKGPEIMELREESERLRNENVQMTRIADESFKERDLAKKAARKAEASSNNAQAEIRILRAQMRDLSLQVQVLIFNLDAQEKGMDRLTEEESAHFAKLRRGQVDENGMNDMSDTHVFITEKFVAFKDIAELQEKNQELLRVTRELADKFENEEALAAKRQAAEDQQEVLKLRDHVARLQDESKSLSTRLKSYMTERDMFRRMLQQKASAAEINSVLGNSVSDREVLASIEQNNPDDHDLSAALRELQHNFDTYRHEQSVDLQAVREQARQLSEEKSALQAEVARLNSQLNLVNERYELLQATNTDLEAQKDHLKKRNSDMSQHLAKTEALAQSRAEDLIETKGLLESMRGENSNLKAEKALWRSIQERLIKDNEELGEEKSRLNALLASQHSLQNERQLSEDEAKRRLQSKIDSLESELNSTKRKLSDEIDGAKKLQLRKEYDSQQAQKRIDDLMVSLSQHKEELVGTKTSRDHLQARVDQLTADLRSAEERAQRLQPRPTAKATASGEPDADEGDDSEARIEELTNEVADLKRELDRASSLLENARAEAEHFKAQASALEEDLASLTESQETFRAEAEEALAAKDSKIKELEQRVEDLSTELANTNTELSSLRDSQGEISRRLEDEKRILESEVSRLKDQESRHRETAKHHQANLRAQADIANKAQQEYEQELFKHAEATQLLQALRTEHNDLKSRLTTLRAEAESAKVKLAQGEASWEERRKQLERELGELKTRRDDANAQNKLLHQQLDNVTTQISGLQQSRAFSDDSALTAPILADTAAEGLRELNSYLRREKEILEVQFELKLQETKRLQQQTDYLQSQLDEARLKLEQERQAQAQSGANSRTYQELMEKLNELNLIRESNVTLRNEAQQAQRQLATRNAKVKELEARLQPLEARVAELDGQKTYLEEEVKQLQEDRDRWQKRTESILTKYGRVDPAELEQLKTSVAELQAERDALKESEEPLKTRLAELEATLESERAGFEKRRSQLVEQAKSKAREQNGSIRSLQEQLGTLTARIASVEADLEAAQTEKKALEEQLRNSQSLLEQQRSQQQQQQEQAGLATTALDDGALHELEQELATVREELQVTFGQKAAAEEELASLRGQLAAAIEDRDRAAALVAQSRQVQQPSLSNGDEVAMQNGGAEAATGSSDAPAPLTDAERATLQTQIAASEAKIVELEKEVAEANKNVDIIVQQRSDRMKEALNKKLRESREQFANEKAELQADFELRLQQERKIWQLENGAAAGPTDSRAAGTLPKIDADTAAAAGTSAAADGQTQQALVDISKIDLSKLDFSKLGDEETRKLLNDNAALKSIVGNNIKKKVDAEMKKLDESKSAEWEAKVASAREQASMMAEKKSALRINMLDNKSKLATAKLGIIEKAAAETPDRPVAQVWEEVKNFRLPPAAAPITATPTPGTPTSSAAVPAPSAVTTAAATSSPTPAAPAPGLAHAATGPAGSRLPAYPPRPQMQQQPGQLPSSFPANPNPLGQSQAGLAPPAHGNPFAAAASQHNPFATPPQIQQPKHPLPAPPPPPPHAQQQANAQHQQAPRTGIPVPSGRGGAAAGVGGAQRGGRGGGGVYNAPRGGQGGGGRGGRGGGGGQSGARAASGNMNPAANEFNPGNKRPRNDGEGGGPAGGPGGKRMRGGGGGSGPGQ